MLSLDDVTIGYGKRSIIEGLSLDLCPPGTVTGLIGPNAAGKSTLVKGITGVHRLAGGCCEVSVDGEVLHGARRRHAVGYVPQSVLDSAALTALETVVMSCSPVCEDAPAAAVAALDRLGIVELAHRTMSELSGGQRQLVAVAQMLARSPRLMILDEPTSALDMRHQVEVLRVLREEARRVVGAALVAIHDLNLAARFCDHLVVLQRGRLRAQGTPSEVLVPELLQDVYGIKARVLDDAGVPVVCPCA